MKNRFASWVLGTAALMGILATDAFALDKTVNIGVLTDMSGLYADIGGEGSVVAAELAIEDSGLKDKGWTINILSGDHQNKADIGANVARGWIDQDKVDVIADVPTSSVVLALNGIVKDKNALLLVSGAGTSELTNGQCSPNTIQWTYDTYLTAHGLGGALTREGAKKWFFMTMDNAGGHSLERDATTAIEKEGGTIVGGVKHPFINSDFSSYLLQAQGSGADVIGLANAGGDTINAIKQASEFGITQGGQKLAAMLMFISDVHALGLDTAQGLSFISAFYWDQDDNTRAFAKRFQERVKSGAMPTMAHAGVYSSLMHYFKALEKLGGNPHDGAEVAAVMKEIPVDDPLFGKGEVQVNGRVTHPAYLFEVKSPAESKGPWDYYKLIATIPADQAFLPLEQSTCELVKK